MFRRGSARRWALAARAVLTAIAALASLPAVAFAQRDGRTTAPAAARSTLHLLSVGISAYGDAAVDQPGAEAFAQALHDSLMVIAGAYHEVRARRLPGPAATREAVMAALDSIATEIQPGDVFILGYRGLAAPRFLVLADSQPLPPPPASPGAAPPASFEGRLLRADVLGPWLAALRTRRIVLVFDAPTGASYFENLREHLAAPPGARVATRDLTAFASPGLPVQVAGGDAPLTALGLALLQALGDEHRDAPIRLASALATRVLERLDYPVMVHQAGADIVLGSSAAPMALANAAALDDSLPWTSTCGAQCPLIEPVGVQQVITLYGRAERLPLGARLWVNGRRARIAGESFEVELPPAALREPLRIRALLPDGSRFESVRRLP